LEWPYASTDRCAFHPPPRQVGFKPAPTIASELGNEVGYVEAEREVERLMEGLRARRRPPLVR
jgi:hypothetical protein